MKYDGSSVAWYVDQESLARRNGLRWCDAERHERDCAFSLGKVLLSDNHSTRMSLYIHAYLHTCIESKRKITALVPASRSINSESLICSYEGTPYRPCVCSVFFFCVSATISSTPCAASSMQPFQQMTYCTLAKVGVICPPPRPPSRLRRDATSIVV